MRLTQIFATFLCVTSFLVSRVDAQDADPLAPPDVLKPVPEKYADANRLWQGVASLDVANDGGLWACWYSGGETGSEENYVLVAHSADQGETWSKPILAIDPPGVVRAFDPTIWNDPDGKLWLFWAQGEMLTEYPKTWDGRTGVWAMTTTEPEKGVDAKWSAPRRLCNGIMLCKPIVDSKDRWLYPVSIWRFDSKYKIDEQLRGADVFISTDKGDTLTFYGRVEVPLAISVFDEHNIVERKDGSFWIWNRTARGIGESFSTDGGRTWSPLDTSEIKHTSSRFFVRRLQSGALLLVKHGPLDEDVDRSRLTAFISDDDGETWSDGLLLDERDDVSYPDGGQNADGTIFITYDFQRYDAREIYVARFTEEDLRAGRIVSDVGKLKLLVNKATGAK